MFLVRHVALIYTVMRDRSPKQHTVQSDEVFCLTKTVRLFWRLVLSYDCVNHPCKAKTRSICAEKNDSMVYLCYVW